jgi:cytochrome bd-type quinol oxidase subunit 2
MNAELASQLKARTARRSARALAVSALGPLTIVGGLVWAFVQPYRITLLHPRGQGFWWLFVEPPLLVMLVGLLFALVVVPGLLEDLEAVEKEES